MIIDNLISSVSPTAIVVSLSPSSLIIYDHNQLKVVLGFGKYGQTVEYAKEVSILLSNDIPSRAGIFNIIVSKNRDYVVLVGSKSAYVVRINRELLISKPDRLQSEYLCESYPLHDSFILQNAIFTVIDARILQQKVKNLTIAAVLYSDNCIRLYDVHQKSNACILKLDFRSFVHDTADISITNNTFGLHKSIVSFDFKPPQSEETSFSILAVDSDAEFYSSQIFFSCLTEGTTPRIERMDVLDGLPCDPICIQHIDTTGQEAASVFSLLSGGAVVTHLIAIPNEFGGLQLMVNDQLQLPATSGDLKFVPNQLCSFYKNRYEIASSTCLFSINIAPWVDALISPNPSNSDMESIVYEMINIVDKELQNKKGKPLKSASIALKSDLNTEEDDEAFESMEETEIMHIAIVDRTGADATHVMAISTFNSKPLLTLETNVVHDKLKGELMAKTNEINKVCREELMKLKPIPACVISDKLSEDEAIAAALNYFKLVGERMQCQSKLSEICVDKCINLQHVCKILDGKQQAIDARLIEETQNVENLKMQMYSVKNRMENVRKIMNVLFLRVEDNVPLSDAEARIFERLQHHQNILSQMSIAIPKLTLDVNEQRRISQQQLMKKPVAQPNKFANVDKNDAEIEGLAARILKLNDELARLK